MKEIEGFFHSSKIMLAHFHFVCNGSAPLHMDWRDPTISATAKLDVEQVNFMEGIIAKISKSEEFVLGLRLKNQYESALYWCHQLFFPDWEPPSPHIAEVP